MRRAGRARCGAGVALLAAALGGAVVVPASADAGEPSAENRAAAKTLLADSARLYEQGQYELALGKLKEAYALVPSPKIHFNVGMAHRALGHPAQALEAFQRFLAEAPDAPKDLRREAEEYVTEMTGAVFTL